jgi:hypothetical protein
MRAVIFVSAFVSYFVCFSLRWANIAFSFHTFEEVSLFSVDKNRTVPISLVVPIILMEVKCLGQFLRSFPYRKHNRGI